MEIKIRNMRYTGDGYPIMVILTPEDKKVIRNMPEDATMFAQFPENWKSEDKMKEWMDKPGTLAEFI